MKPGMCFVLPAVLAVGSIPAPGFGQAPPFIHVQGVLTDNDGIPVTDTVSLAFEVFADTAAASLWSVTLPAVIVVNGFYEAYLDMGALPFDAPYFLGIAVNGAALGPKKPLASVPYSMRSARTEVTAGPGLTGSSDTMTVTLSIAAKGVTTAMLQDAAVTPDKIAAAAVMTGHLADSSLTSAKIAAGAAVRSLNGRTGHVSLLEGSNVTITDGVGGLTISAAGGGGGDGDWTVSGDDMYSAVAGNVGIGTATPVARLDVEGPIALSGYIQGRDYFGTGILDSAGAVGVWVENGRVGIGTDQPSNDFSVLGSAGISGNLTVGDGSSSDSDYVYFDDFNTDWLMWAEGSDRFEFSGPLSIGGALGVGDGAFFRAPTAYSTFQLGVETPVPTSGEMDNSGDVYIQDDLEVDGDAFVDGQIITANNLVVNADILCDSLFAWDHMYCGYGNSTDDDYIYFDGTARNDWLKWKEVANRFELSNDLSIGGVIAAGHGTIPNAPIYPYSYITLSGQPFPLSGDISTAGDLFIDYDIEAGSDLYYAGSLVDVGGMAPGKGGSPPAEVDAEAALRAFAGLRPRVIPIAKEEAGKAGRVVSKIGFLPSEVPEIVRTAEGNGYRPLDLVAILTKVVQEQQKTIDALEARVRVLEEGR
ncbi:MAG: hypothetical protein ABIK65_09645 [Candidatus Eisenbacteria bacterium]